MQCAILIGGLGTRLGALVRDCPKPMLPVAGRPFLDHLVANLARFGFRDIVLLAGYRADVVRAHFDSPENPAARLGLNVKISVEPAPLGTAGALRYARAHLASEFMLINGDSFFDFNLLDLATYPVDGPWMARMALRRVKDLSRYGAVTLEKDGTVSEMREKPDAGRSRGGGLINGGIYWLKRDITGIIPEGSCSLERDIFPALASRGLLHGREYDGFFLDTGVPDDYASAQKKLPLRRPAVFFDRDGVLNHDAGYTHRKEGFRWIDGAMEAVRAANDANYLVFVVTNQAGVARGFYRERDVRRLHDWMNGTLRARGAHVDDFRYCPHHPEGVVNGYARACSWRKPNPGMLEDLLGKWPIDKAASILIGDKQSDLDAAWAAGVPARLFKGGNLLETVRSIPLKTFRGP